MNSRIKEDFEKYTHPFTEAEHKAFKTDILRRLISKLENEENSQIETELINLVSQLATPSQDKDRARAYRKSLRTLQRNVKTAFGFELRGSLKEKYIGVGIALGVALGAGIFNDSGGAGTGIVLGIVLGVVLGGSEEKKAEEKGLLY